MSTAIDGTIRNDASIRNDTSKFWDSHAENDLFKRESKDVGQPRQGNPVRRAGSSVGQNP